MGELHPVHIYEDLFMVNKTCTPSLALEKKLYSISQNSVGSLYECFEVVKA